MYSLKIPKHNGSSKQRDEKSYSEKKLMIANKTSWDDTDDEQSNCKLFVYKRWTSVEWSVENDISSSHRSHCFAYTEQRTLNVRLDFKGDIKVPEGLELFSKLLTSLNWLTIINFNFGAVIYLIEWLKLFDEFLTWKLI